MLNAPIKQLLNAKPSFMNLEIPSTLLRTLILTYPNIQHHENLGIYQVVALIIHFFMYDMII